MCLGGSRMTEKHLTNCRQHRGISMHHAEQQPIFLSVVLDEDEKEDADVDLWNSEVTKLVL